MKAEIDRDRLNVRLRLKATLPRYQAFAAEHSEGFGVWWATLPLPRKQGICVMPVAEVPVIYSTELDVRNTYGTVRMEGQECRPFHGIGACGPNPSTHRLPPHQLLSAVLEQVRRFPETGYAPDGATAAEAAFEAALVVKQGAFILTPEYLEPPRSFLDLVRLFVGGPKLLLPHPKRSSESGGISGNKSISSTETSSFRGDRRLLRVMIARYIVDRAVRQYEKAAPPISHAKE